MCSSDLTNQDGDPIRQGYFTPIVQSYSMDHNRSVYTILSFAVFYLGIVLIFICATILAIQQLSDAAKYRYRYDICLLYTSSIVSQQQGQLLPDAGIVLHKHQLRHKIYSFLIPAK